MRRDLICSSADYYVVCLTHFVAAVGRGLGSQTQARQGTSGLGGPGGERGERRGVGGCFFCLLLRGGARDQSMYAHTMLERRRGHASSRSRRATAVEGSRMRSCGGRNQGSPRNSVHSRCHPLKRVCPCQGPGLADGTEAA